MGASSATAWPKSWLSVKMINANGPAERARGDLQCFSCEKWRSARAMLLASNPRKWLLTATIGLSDRVVADSAKTSMHVMGV
jgi:hypothetical protein